MAVQKQLGSEVTVDWTDVRVICIAPNYKKYDLHAVQVMGANIELWKYRLYANNNLYLEEVFSESDLPILIDISDYHLISEDFRKHIDEVGKVWK